MNGSGSVGELPSDHNPGPVSPHPLRASPKLHFLRYLNTAAVTVSQRRIRRLARRASVIFLDPTRPRGCGGHIDEYYHFVFDLLHPLHLLLESTPDDVEFVLEPFGANTERLSQIFPERVRVQERDTIGPDVPSVRLIGMNPKGIVRRNGMYEGLRRRVFDNLGISGESPSAEIVLVERMPPDEDHLEKATVKWSGSLRRSIANHAELAEALGSAVADGDRFHNLRLETLSFRAQVQHFADARMVIAQHGAALANCVWMPPGSIVVELNHVDNVTHFNMIARTKEHRYRMYRTSDAHAEIDVDHFVDWLRADPLLAPHFPPS
jgi:hypothetical protein